jgi:hypothetical protein
MNQSIYNKHKPPDTVIVIAVRKSEWLGHGVRMDSETTVKKLLESQPVGGRKYKEDLDKGGWMISN